MGIRDGLNPGTFKPALLCAHFLDLGLLPITLKVRVFYCLF